jgi:hypothetical protein
VLLMTLVSMTTADGTKPPTVKLVPFLVCQLSMVRNPNLMPADITQP